MIVSRVRVGLFDKNPAIVEIDAIRISVRFLEMCSTGSSVCSDYKGRACDFRQEFSSPFGNVSFLTHI